MPMMFRSITEGRKEASGRALERGDVHADQRDCNTYSAQVDGCFVFLCFFVFFFFTIIQFEAKILKTSIEILLIVIVLLPSIVTIVGTLVGKIPEYFTIFR